MRKILYVVLTLAVILSLSACSGRNTVSTDGESTNPSTMAEDTDSTQPHTHSFAAATCTEPKKCECGATEGEALGHDWAEATCEAPKTCSVCRTTEGHALGHNWTKATCKAPKTCSVCRETEGQALGHKWTKATCKAPKTCSVCRETEGQALGHKWTKATCKAPKTCSVCKATEDQALGHNWTEATCKAPKTCSVCKATEGGIGNHTYKDGKCTVCGALNALNPTTGIKIGEEYVAKVYRYYDAPHSIDAPGLCFYNDGGYGDGDYYCLMLEAAFTDEPDVDYVKGRTPVIFNGREYYRCGAGFSPASVELTDTEIIITWETEIIKAILLADGNIKITQSNDDFFAVGTVLSTDWAMLG